MENFVYDGSAGEVPGHWPRAHPVCLTVHLESSQINGQARRYKIALSLQSVVKLGQRQQLDIVVVDDSNRLNCDTLRIEKKALGRE
jgi:hypothetical protein